MHVFILPPVDLLAQINIFYCAQLTDLQISPPPVLLVHPSSSLALSLQAYISAIATCMGDLPEEFQKALMVS